MSIFCGECKREIKKDSNGVWVTAEHGGFPCGLTDDGKHIPIELDDQKHSYGPCDNCKTNDGVILLADTVLCDECWNDWSKDIPEFPRDAQCPHGLVRVLCPQCNDLEGL